MAAGTRCHDDWLLQTDTLNVADDLIKNAAVAFSGIEHFDPVQRNHLKLSLAVLFVLVHATLLMRMRRVIPYR